MSNREPSQRELDQLHHALIKVGQITGHFYASPNDPHMVEMTVQGWVRPGETRNGVTCFHVTADGADVAARVRIAGDASA